MEANNIVANLKFNEKFYYFLNKEWHEMYWLGKTYVSYLWCKRMFYVSDTLTKEQSWLLEDTPIYLEQITKGEQNENL